MALVGLTYSIEYLFHSSTPGKIAQFPLGWWGWFDQGKYLLSANAIAHFDFSAGKHFYPPLYPLLGSIFVRWWGSHTFWLIDLLSLLWFSAVFLSLAKKYIPQLAAIVVLLLSLLTNYTIFENFLIPWTSTVSAALLSTGIYGLLRLDDAATGKRTLISRLSPFVRFRLSLIIGSNARAVLRAYGRFRLRRSMHPRKMVSYPSSFAAFGISCATGLIVCLRPADILVGAVLWLPYAWGIWRLAHLKTSKLITSLPRAYYAAGGGLLVGPAILICFNYVVYGSLMGGYVHLALSNGYFPADAAEKFVSLFLDGYTLYLEPSAGLIDHYPWLAVSLVGIGYILIKGDLILRTVAIAVCAQFAVYLPYGDALPNGLWRYLNIHYFKWTFPYLGLFAYLIAAFLVREWSVSRKRCLVGLVASLASLSFLLSIRYVIEPKSVTVITPFIASSAATTMISVRLKADTADLIDVAGLQGGFPEVYHGGHRLWADGEELVHVRDFRVLPAPWGIRVLFIRPTVAQLIRFQPDSRLIRSRSGLRVAAGSYTFTLGLPKLFRNEEEGDPPPVYKLGEAIDMSISGDGSMYSREGWAQMEPWGRWTVGKSARLRFRLEVAPKKPMFLYLRLRAYVRDQHPRQRLVVHVNGGLIGQLEFLAQRGGTVPRDEAIQVPASLIGDDREVTVSLITPDSVAPIKFGNSTDIRELGLGVESVRLSAMSPESIVDERSPKVISLPSPAPEVEAKWEGGFSGEEAKGLDTWRWCSEVGVLRLINKSRNTAWVRLSSTVKTAWPDDAVVHVKSVLFTDNLVTNVAGLEWARLVGVPSGEHVVTFTSSARKHPASRKSDPRVLVFALWDFKLSRANAPVGGSTPKPLMRVPVTVAWGPGAYPEETDKIGSWHWCSAACEITLVNPSAAPAKVRLAMGVSTWHEKPAKFYMRGPGLSDTVMTSSAMRPLAYTLVLPRGKNVFKMSSDAPRVPAPGDPRNMVFMVRDLVLTRVSEDSK